MFGFLPITKALMNFQLCQESITFFSLLITLLV